MISVRKVQYRQAYKFINECLNYFDDYNSNVRPNIETEDSVYIVNNGSKDVGMFTISIMPDGSEIQPTFWLHPKSCKMGLLNIQKAAAIHCYTRALKEEIDVVIIKCKDLLTCRTVKRLCPGFISHSLTHNIHLCVCALDEIEDKYKVDSNYCFEMEI